MRPIAPLLCLVASVFLLSPEASALPQDHPRALLEMLRAVDTIPSAEGIRETTQNPEGALRKVADDEVLGQYVRRRATSLLSLFPGTRSRVHLKELTQSRSERVSWVATYTYIRVQGKEDAKRARRFAKQVLTTRADGQREAAVRGLRHVPGKATAQLVERHAKNEVSKRVLKAIKRFRESRAR